MTLSLASARRSDRSRCRPNKSLRQSHGAGLAELPVRCRRDHRRGSLPGCRPPKTSLANARCRRRRLSVATSRSRWRAHRSPVSLGQSRRRVNGLARPRSRQRHPLQAITAPRLPRRRRPGPPSLGCRRSRLATCRPRPASTMPSPASRRRSPRPLPPITRSTIGPRSRPEHRRTSARRKSHTTERARASITSIRRRSSRTRSSKSPRTSQRTAARTWRA